MLSAALHVQCAESGALDYISLAYVPTSGLQRKTQVMMRALRMCCKPKPARTHVLSTLSTRSDLPQARLEMMAGVPGQT